MAQKAQKKQNTDPVDLEPVELDPPAPELVRWEALADRDVDIYHDGDVARIISAERPAWSDLDEDLIDNPASSAVYMSSPAKVALSLERGRAYGDTLQPGRVAVRAFMGRMFDQDLYGVEVKFVEAIRGEENSQLPWRHTHMSLTASEARELADVLLAAVDLIGGAK